MKLKKSLTVFLLFAGCALLAMSPDLWKEYETARKADKPRTQMEILDRIIDVAAAGRGSWDFYDAWTKKVSVGSSVNWKDRSRLAAARDSAFAAYGEPVIDLVCDRLDEAAVRESAGILVKKVNRGFYESGRFWRSYGSEFYGKALGRLVNNDYEFALWYLLGRSEGPDAVRIRSLIVQTAGAQSQQAAYAGFDEVKRHADSLSSIAEKCALYEKYEKRWNGSAAALLAGQALLSLKMDSLCRDRAATSVEFRKLRGECSVFEDRRASFTGTGKILAGECTVVEELIGRLDGRELYVSADSAGVKVSFRNIAGARLEISEDDLRAKETVYCDTVVNEAGSYYVLDTVVVPFPVRDDGDFVARVSASDKESVCNIARHSISVAAVNDAGGYKLYAARYDSGEPLGSYDLALYQNKTGNLVASCQGISQEGGFVSVPDEVASVLKTSATSRHYVVCSYTDSCGVFHTSGKLSFSGQVSYTRPDVGENRLRAVLFTDCGAYRRGDAVHCKGIIYRGDYMDEMAVAAKNTQARMSLLDPDGNVIATRQLKTNDFGSVMADFTLPSDIKGGLCSIALESGERLCSTSLRVDDYVLPDFYCEFDRIDSLYFAGDSVTVSGRVKSYTGHRVPVSDALFRIPGTDIRERAAINQDGSFIVKVPVPASGYWGSSLTLVVSTDTGSTLQFTKYIPAGRYLDLSVSLENETPASVSKDGGPCSVLCEDKGIFVPRILNSDGVPQRIPVTYSVSRGNVRIAGGEVLSGEKLELELCGEGDYNVTFKASARNASGRTFENSVDYTIIRVSPGSGSVRADVENIFIPRSDEGIAFDFAASRGPVWAVVSLYGNDGESLYEGTLHLSGKRGADGSMVHVALPFEDTYPDTVTLRTFYFRNGEMYQWSHEYERPSVKEDFVLNWSRVEEKGVPGTEYTFTLEAAPSSEVMVSVFDKSTETLQSNMWSRVEPCRSRTVMPYLGSVTGTMGRDEPILTRGMALMSVNKSLTADTAAGTPETGQDEGVRSDFSTILCWQPQLKVSREGEVKVAFRTSDKTGTFVLSAFAHNQAMKSAVSRKEMTVSLPVELSVAEPVVLHEGDRHVLKAVLSASDIAVSGTLLLDAGVLGTFPQEIEVGENSSVNVSFVLDVPYGVDRLPLKLKFTDRGEHFSDALAFSVPISSSRQTLTESHSLLLRDGTDRNAALASLRAAFVNTGSDDASLREITVPEMLADALAPHKAVSERSVLGLTDAIATNLLYNHLTGGDEDVSAMKRMLSSFVGDDGGFAWISGMSSSPIVTATVLERNARVQARTGEAFLDESAVAAALHYLDKRSYDSLSGRNGVFCWTPEISLEKYLYVRSFYPSVAFEPVAKGSAAGKDAAKSEKEFGDAVSAYLFPGDVRMLPGHIFAKVLRLATLENLYALKDGDSLLEGWNAGAHSTIDVLKSMLEDIESLVEYAVPHRDGGVYFPNLVMPYRGLLSSEAYCHSLLCDLLAPYVTDTADGIRLWLLLQKETQAWENDFSFTNAAASIMGGSDKLKNTSVMVLSKEYERPYREIQATGNGFRISRHFVLTSEDGRQSELEAGGTVNAGDRITAVYRIWNAENRSFVRLSLPSYACLRPVDQLSGNLGWNIRSLNGGTFNLVPQGYREVRYDRIDYYFDSFPEEDVEIRDEFFVTQTGTFTAPVVSVESLYAPHYRANGAFEGGMTAR